MAINRIFIENFKSIRKQEIKISAINILVGANGVGKSNFIGFFSLIKNLYDRNLTTYIATHGKANSFLYYGRQGSDFIRGEIIFENSRSQITNSYEFKLIPTDSGGLFIDSEKSKFNRGYQTKVENWDIDTYAPSEESMVSMSSSFRNNFLREYVQGFNVFHFHDTSRSSKLKQANQLNDNRELKRDGSNLAAFLFMLKTKHPIHFNLIEKTIQSIAPFFDRFDLEPDFLVEDEINLVWKEVGSDQYFNANNLSDGTLRFIALATLLLQPEPPKTIIIDEPELGLHPSAIRKITALIKSASKKSQIIISSQSVTLLNDFSPKDIIVVEREKIAGKQSTVFKRFEDDNLKQWLEGYSLGEIWEKNIIGGKP